MSLTIRGKLPKGDTNGLAHLETALATDSDEVLVVVGLLRADTIEDRLRDPNDPRIIKTMLLHVEALDGADRAEADRMLRKVYEARTGKVVLPFEDE